MKWQGWATTRGWNKTKLVQLPRHSLTLINIWYWDNLVISLFKVYLSNWELDIELAFNMYDRFNFLYMSVKIKDFNHIPSALSVIRVLVSDFHFSLIKPIAWKKQCNDLFSFKKNLWQKLKLLNESAILDQDIIYYQVIVSNWCAIDITYTWFS